MIVLKFETLQTKTEISLISYTELKRRKEGNVLFNDALNTFSYGYMSSDIR